MSLNKTILVTGGGGFIGANLIRKLQKQNHNVHLILKRSTNPWRLTDILPKIKIHEVNLLEKENLQKLVNKVKPQVIYNLASHGAYSVQRDINEIINTNIIGTLNLLITTKNIPYEIFVNIGTSSEYGFKKKAMRETELLEPTSFYAASKASSTLICKVFSREFNKPIVTLRPFSVYGFYEEKTRFIPTIMNNLIDGKDILLTPGSIRRDFIYVEDFISACLITIKKKKKLTGEVINIGSGKEYTNDEVVNQLFKIVKKRVKVVKGAYPSRSWDTTHWIADISKAKELLAWEPKHSLEDGLIKTYKWIIKNKELL